MPSPPTPREGLMALAGRRSGGVGGFPGATSLCRGTTDAPFASEVEQKVSNLVAHSPAERSSSYLQARAGWQHPTRLDVSGFTSSNPRSPASQRGLFRVRLSFFEERHFRRLTGRLVSGRGFRASFTEGPTPVAGLRSLTLQYPKLGSVPRPVAFPQRPVRARARVSGNRLLSPNQFR
jgi:hypothetical protein